MTSRRFTPFARARVRTGNIKCIDEGQDVRFMSVLVKGGTKWPLYPRQWDAFRQYELVTGYLRLFRQLLCRPRAFLMYLRFRITKGKPGTLPVLQ